jgi:hypothetical protein
LAEELSNQIRASRVQSNEDQVGNLTMAKRHRKLTAQGFETNAKPGGLITYQPADNGMAIGEFP